MRRRDVVGLVGGAAAWPLAARAQQRVPVVGFLRSTSAVDSAVLVAAFRRGLSESRLIEGQSVAIEFQFADGNLDRLPALAADLVRRRVAAIITNQQSMPDVMAATKTIPIVFVTGGDPIRQGFVASLNRPGGNITGVSFVHALLGEKRLGLLHELAPKARIIAALLDPNAPDHEVELRDFETAARAIGRELLIVNAATERDFNPAFDTFEHAGAGGVLVASGAFIFSHRRQLAALANRHGLPALYSNREFVEVGGLMSYGASQIDAYRRAAGYVSRILAGTKPADLPVELPTKFELVINLGTARALDLTVPPTLLAIADEVIDDRDAPPLRPHPPRHLCRGCGVAAGG
jgi:putative ABC transport system substrate-binding protein